MTSIAQGATIDEGSLDPLHHSHSPLIDGFWAVMIGSVPKKILVNTKTIGKLLTGMDTFMFDHARLSRRHCTVSEFAHENIHAQCGLAFQVLQKIVQCHDPSSSYTDATDAWKIQYKEATLWKRYNGIYQDNGCERPIQEALVKHCGITAASFAERYKTFVPPAPSNKGMQALHFYRTQSDRQ
jgi:hypothetical protein